MRSLNSLQGSVVGTSTTTDLAIQGDGYFVVSDSSGAALSHPERLVRARRGGQSRQFGRLLPDGQHRRQRPSRSVEFAHRHEKVNVTASGDLPTATTAGTLSVNLPSTATAVTTAADLPSANPAAAIVSYTDETSVTAYDNLGGAHTINLYLTNTGVDAATGQDTWEITAYDAASRGLGRRLPLFVGPTASGDGNLSFSPTRAP